MEVIQRHFSCIGGVLALGVGAILMAVLSDYGGPEFLQWAILLGGPVPIMIFILLLTVLPGMCILSDRVYEFSRKQIKRIIFWLILLPLIPACVLNLANYFYSNYFY